MTPNETFLLTMLVAAKSAGHIFPEYAACEAALETAKTIPGAPPNSNFGQDAAFLQGFNCFGNKQRAKPVYQTLSLPTFEIINGQRRDMMANWIKFPSIATAFSFRMQTLQQYRPIYAEALNSNTGEQFIRNVSAQWAQVDPPANPAAFVYQFVDGVFKFVKPRWSTGPARASTVLEIYEAHKDLLNAPPMPATETV